VSFLIFWGFYSFFLKPLKRGERTGGTPRGTSQSCAALGFILKTSYNEGLSSKPRKVKDYINYPCKQHYFNKFPAITLPKLAAKNSQTFAERNRSIF